MLHGITIDKIQDFLNDNSIGYYMNWDDGKIEIDIRQEDTKYNRLVGISGGLKPMPK